MINQIDPSQIDIRVGAAKYFKELRESRSIKYMSTTIYFNGFATPRLILSKDDLPEIKGIIPPEPRKKFDAYNKQSMWMFSSCQIKRAFEDDSIRNPLKSALNNNLWSLLS